MSQVSLWLFKGIHHRECNNKWEFGVKVIHIIKLLFTVQSVFQQGKGGSYVSPPRDAAKIIKRVCPMKDLLLEPMCSLTSRPARARCWPQNHFDKTYLVKLSLGSSQAASATSAVSPACLLELLVPQTVRGSPLCWQLQNKLAYLSHTIPRGRSGHTVPSQLMYSKTPLPKKNLIWLKTWKSASGEEVSGFILQTFLLANRTIGVHFNIPHLPTSPLVFTPTMY